MPQEVIFLLSERADNPVHPCKFKLVRSSRSKRQCGEPHSTITICNRVAGSSHRNSEFADESANMAKPNHSNIRVLDEQRSVEFYQKSLGLRVSDRVSFDDFTLVFLNGSESEFELELTINHGRVEPYTHGTGYGHFAVSVEGLEREHDRCVQLGLSPTPIKELFSEGHLAVRFFFLTDPDGYKVEVVQRQGRYR